ncbi:CPCC family cysteine-rich protein [Streptomyces sp. NPDC005566]|uniref:CPCC family cysteine-rich protein n=1 Tax=Streptomyces sp. NPDC005566 TaxID=3156886 RepID=UPI0033BDD7A2
MRGQGPQAPRRPTGPQHPGVAAGLARRSLRQARRTSVLHPNRATSHPRGRRPAPGHPRPTAAEACPTLLDKHFHPHVLRHSCAMSLLQTGVDTTVIALCLGDSGVRSTDAYVHADMTIKEKALSRRAWNTQGVMTPGELRAACPAGEGPYPCPCCKLPTLDERVAWEICHECSWEDDGQDDLNADEVWGGPNGSESLTDARLDYAQYAATRRATDPRSVVNGGQGRWLEACVAYRVSRGLPERFATPPTPATMPNTAERKDCSASGDLAR